jgi:peptidoglycan/xylan/chitin deacetylase (PgdA/CDA1 family)
MIIEMRRKARNFVRQRRKVLTPALICLLVVESLLVGGYLLINIGRNDKVVPSSVAVSTRVIAKTKPPKPTVQAITPIPANDYTIPAISNGLAPVLSRIPTAEPVVFLGIDDGIYQEPTAAALMKANNVKASLFLVYRFIKTNPSYFADLSARTGSMIENHTYDHSWLTSLNYDQQKQEICSNADIFTQWFGRRPIIMRPPGGYYNATTQAAAATCGMQAVIMWDATVNNGSLQYQVGHGLRPGDIVLMHFRTTFVEDMQAFINAEKAAGLHTDLLENWLPNSATD